MVVHFLGLEVIGNTILFYEHVLWRLQALWSEECLSAVFVQSPSYTASSASKVAMSE